MANRKLYKLELNNNAVIIYRTAKNIGRQGVYFNNGIYRREYNSRPLPQYIINTCKNILKASKFELMRGYNLSGQNCEISNINDIL